MFSSWFSYSAVNLLSGCIYHLLYLNCDEVGEELSDFIFEFNWLVEGRFLVISLGRVNEPWILVILYL